MEEQYHVHMQYFINFLEKDQNTHFYEEFFKMTKDEIQTDKFIDYII